MEWIYLFAAGMQKIKRYRDFTFKTNTIKIEEPTNIYMFSDGFQDQFGGPKKFKFTKKRMKQLFLDSYNQSIESQKTIISEAFNSWKGEMNQTDDILVMGVALRPN